jgi:hypothetical protein
VPSYSTALSSPRLALLDDAGALTSEHQLVLSFGHISPFAPPDTREGGTLTWYEGASLAQLRVFPHKTTRRPGGEYGPEPLPGMALHPRTGATWQPVKRGAIGEFSRNSRARLIRLLNTVDYSCLAFLPKFLTLTYPADFPADPATAQSHLGALRNALYRKFGPFPVVWRREFQERGAPHFHLLLFLLPWVDHLWLKRTWQRIIGSTGSHAFHRGVDIRMPRNLRRVRSYVSKYMAKLPDTPGEPGASVGRSWGVWQVKGLPIHPCTVLLPPGPWFAARRVLKTYQRKHGYEGMPLGERPQPGKRLVCLPERVGITTFLPAGDARRLAEFLTAPSLVRARVPASAGGKKGRQLCDTGSRRIGARRVHTGSHCALAARATRASSITRFRPAME